MNSLPLSRLVSCTLLCWLSWSTSMAGEALTAASVLPAKLTSSNGSVQLSDGQGGSWEFEYHGTLDSRSVSNMHHLRLDGNWSFQGNSQPQVTSDGQECVATATYNSIQVIRRARSMPSLGLVRVVDIFINSGGQPVTTTVGMYSSMNWNPVQVLSDQGQPIATGMGKKDSALVMPVPMQYHQHGYRDVFMMLCSPSSRLKPAVQLQRNYMILNWSLTIPAGKAVALVHAVADRPPGSATNPQTVKATLAGVRSRAFLADLPAPLRKVMANWGGSMGSDIAPDLAGGIPEDLIEARGADADLLALGGGTRLRGEASGVDVKVQIDGTQHGIPWTEIMALHGGNKPAVYLRTGDVLIGAQVDGTCTFTLSTGQQVPMTLQRIGWLLRRPEGEEKLPPGEVLIQLDDYQRVVGKPAGSRLQCSTLWGQLDLRLEDIASLTPDQDSGSQIVLRDGSRFSGYLTDGVLSIDTRFTGRRTIALKRITGIIGGKLGNEETETAPVVPHVVLAGNQTFMGIIDLPELHLRLEGNRLPVPPPQIRLLESQSEGDAIGLDHLLPRLRLELWSGDVAEGLLEETALPFRTTGGTLLIPPSDVREVHVPIPVMAPATRARIAELMAQLGDRDWAKREAAVKAMVQLGEIVRQPVEEAVQVASDPEVKARLEQVLSDLK